MATYPAYPTRRPDWIDVRGAVMDVLAAELRRIDDAIALSPPNEDQIGRTGSAPDRTHPT